MFFASILPIAVAAVAPFVECGALDIQREIDEAAARVAGRSSFRRGGILSGR